jgi:hypothetical protein
MLYRYAAYVGEDVSASASLDAFKDAAKVSSYAKPAMQWAVAKGFIVGNADGSLNPSGSATRAEMASIIARYMAASQTAAAK